MTDTNEIAVIAIAVNALALAWGYLGAALHAHTRPEARAERVATKRRRKVEKLAQRLADASGNEVEVLERVVPTEADTELIGSLVRSEEPCGVAGPMGSKCKGPAGHTGSHAAWGGPEWEQSEGPF